MSGNRTQRTRQTEFRFMATISRRKLLLGASAGSLTLLTLNTHAAGSRFLAVRIWPGQSYTRITLESDGKVRYKYFTLTNPHRLVIDLEDVDFNNVLSGIANKVSAGDPYVRQIRAGQKDSKTVRIVFDLKTAVAPQVFALAPVSNFKHRLVADLYPSGGDPIQAFWESRNRKETAQNNIGGSGGKAKGRRPVVVIDPGHGGEDTGAISANKIYEKDVVLGISREMKKRLEDLGCQVRMTRNEDIFIKLQERTAIAQRAGADIFVSIHANSVPEGSSTKPRGAEIFILSKTGASSEATRLLEEKENNADNVGGVKMSSSKEINNVLMDMVQNQTLVDSSRLGRLVLNQVGKHIPLHKRYVDRANFVVLRSPDIPSILVEAGFMSNPQDEALLRSGAFQRKMGHAIADGVKQYLNAAVLARR